MNHVLQLMATLVFGASLSGCGGGEETAAGEPLPTAYEIRVTHRSLDVAVNGEGLFVLQSDSGSQRSYSRMGRLGSDHQGRIIHADGSIVLGTSSEPGLDAEPLPQAALSIPARMTTKASIEGNLDSRVEASFTQFTPFDPSNPASYHATTSMTIFAPNARSLILYFRKFGDGGWQIYPELDGQVLGVNLVLLFPISGLANDSTERILYIPAGEAGLMAAIEVDLSKFTQFAGGYQIANMRQDGYPAGALRNSSVSTNGELTHWYDNGQSKPGGQLVLALFTVADRLQRFGANSWLCRIGCAPPQIGIPGSALIGVLQGGALNSSN